MSDQKTVEEETTPSPSEDLKELMEINNEITNEEILKQEENSPKSLEDMPEELMKRITEEAGYSAIQRLRLVNHNFNAFINEHQPEYFLNEFSLQLILNQINLTIKHGKDIVKLHLSPHENGAQLIRGTAKEVFEKSNFLDLSLKKLEDVLNCQTSVFDRFTVDLSCRGIPNRDEFFERIKRAIQNGKIKPLQTRMIDIIAENREILELLALVDPNFLKKIRVRSWEPHPEEIMESAQWNAATELEAYGAWFNVDLVGRLTRFSVLDTSFATMDLNAINVLRRNFLTSPTFQSAMITYKKYYADLVDYERLMHDSLDYYENRLRIPEPELYFRTPGSDQVLFHYFTDRRSRFERFPLSKIPNHIQIQEI